MAAVLFTMLGQSIHSFSHLHQLFSEKECHHKYTGQTEISHQHHPFDHCFVCEFTFGTFLSPNSFLLQLHPDFIRTLPLLSKFDLVIDALNNQNFLRGPPQFIV
jgi:hypothetical protein